MKKLTSLSVVLLAYHEEEVIQKNIETIKTHISPYCNQYEIIVVGFEGCKDQTNNIVLDLSSKDSKISLVIQPTIEKGYGRAYAIGIKAAKYDWIFQTDADGQYLLSDIEKIIDLADDQTDVVHGYRKERKDPFERIVMAFCYNVALKILYKLPLKDIDSAFKLIRREKIKDLPLISLSGFCVAESMIRILNNGGRFKQLPITHLPRTSGEALSEKGIKNPFNLQLPNLELIYNTLSEAFLFKSKLKKELSFLRQQ